jgi:hypothetical protein
MGKLKDLAEKCCTQETFVIENPGPKLLAFINDMRERKNKMIEESKREYIRHAFLSDDNMHNTFYWYKDIIKYKVNLNDKYVLHILTENYPDDETDEKLENALESFGYEGDVIFLKNDEDEYQVFGVFNNGTNGKEGCILNSMKDVTNRLEKLKSNENVKWCQILDTTIDNMDDVYAWYLTFTLK